MYVHSVQKQSQNCGGIDTKTLADDVVGRALVFTHGPRVSSSERQRRSNGNANERCERCRRMPANGLRARGHGETAVAGADGNVAVIGGADDREDDSLTPGHLVNNSAAAVAAAPAV